MIGVVLRKRGRRLEESLTTSSVVIGSKEESIECGGGHAMLSVGDMWALVHVKWFLPPQAILSEECKPHLK